MLLLDAFDQVARAPTLADDEIHLWFCSFGPGRAALASTMPRRAQDLLYHVLRAYLGCPLGPTDFRIGEFGRPSLQDWPSLGFNLSHTRSAAIVAVARNIAPGVDLEPLGRPRPVVALARRYFCPAEAGVLEALPAGEAQRSFLALWTAKEAVLKAIGRGLAFGLHRLEFSLTLAGELSDLSAIATEAGPVDSWQCCAIRPEMGTIGCLAWQGRRRRIRGYCIDESLVPCIRHG